MRNVSLFIAMSLDGYIADSSGSVNWLNGQEPDAEMPDTYSEFIQDIDTVILGWNTYHQVVTELSKEEWIYKDLKSYVLTHQEMHADEQMEELYGEQSAGYAYLPEFVSEHPCELIRRLRTEDGKGIWICGGAQIVQQLVKEDFIDRYYISVIPTILGDGIRLFGNMVSKTDREIPLKLMHTQNYNGIVELVYERRTKK